jgi:hypothetical protein
MSGLSCVRTELTTLPFLLSDLRPYAPLLPISRGWIALEYLADPEVNVPTIRGFAAWPCTVGILRCPSSNRASLQSPGVRSPRLRAAKRLPVAGGKLFDCASHCDPVNIASQIFVPDPYFEASFTTLLVSVRLVQRYLAQRFFTKMHQDRVDRDTVQPGRKRGSSPKAGELAERQDERILRKVFRLGDIVGHAQTYGVDSSLVRIKQGGKCVRVPFLSALYQFKSRGNLFRRNVVVHRSLLFGVEVDLAESSAGIESSLSSATCICAQLLLDHFVSDRSRYPDCCRLA